MKAPFMKFSLSLDNGSYKIRFNLDGRRKTLRPGTSDHATALAIQKRMTYEWETGQFDLSLDSYKVNAIKQDDSNVTKEISERFKPTLLSLWNSYLESLENGSASHWLEITRVLPDDVLCDDNQWFIAKKSEWSASTYNRRLSSLKKCLDYAVDKGIIKINPYSSLKRKKVKQTEDKIKPFTKTEIKAIIQALKTDKFNNPNSAYTHSHYLPFVVFLFSTACRTGEAVALQWKHIDFDNNQVTIAQSYSKSSTDSRKHLGSTKTGRIRHIPMTKELKQVLQELKPDNVRLDSFVFRGCRSNKIDSDNFRNRVWKPILKGLGIPYRYPYQTRHTVLSAIVSNQGLLAAKQIAGHGSLDMVSRHYARFNNTVDMPSLI